MQKHVNLVDLVKSFPTNIYLQNLASIQKRTSPVKSAHLAEKSGKGSISNLSTKASTRRSASSSAASPAGVRDSPAGVWSAAAAASTRRSASSSAASPAGVCEKNVSQIYRTMLQKCLF